MFGNPVPNAYFPGGTEISLGDDIKGCMINISLSACKSFGYNKETKCFEYDVGVNGKPFYGSIPANSVLDVIDLDTKESYGNLGKPSENVELHQNDNNVFEKPKLVSYNKDIIHKKSEAELYLVA